MDFAFQGLRAHFRMEFKRSVDAEDIGLKFIEHGFPVRTEFRLKSVVARHFEKRFRIVAAAGGDAGKFDSRNLADALEYIEGVSAFPDHAKFHENTSFVDYVSFKIAVFPEKSRRGEK